MAHRYDYRNDYKTYTIIQLREELSTLIDRLLDTYRDDTRDNCMKRISYVEGKIKKYDAKHYPKVTQ
jgi:hypothetical protein